jgi:AcrR family transcriptional regulator
MARRLDKQSLTLEVLDRETIGRTALEERVLDAALELAVAVGPGHTTLSDVARRAGVSRGSIYRKWSNVEAIFVELLDREYITIATQVIIEDAATHAATENTPDAVPKRDRVVIALQTVANRIKAVPLLYSMTHLDPAAVVSALFIEAHPALINLIDMLEFHIVLHSDDGTLRDDDPHQVATTVVMTIIGFIMTGPILFPDDATLQRSLVGTIDRLLRPIEDLVLPSMSADERD